MNLVRAFFPKSGHFSLNFEKGQGRPSSPLPLWLRAWTYIHELFSLFFFWCFLLFMFSIFPRNLKKSEAAIHMISRQNWLWKFCNFQRSLLSLNLEIYNRFHNILRLFDVLPNFPFTTSEMMDHYYLSTWYIRVASRVAEQF